VNWRGELSGCWLTRRARICGIGSSFSAIGKPEFTGQLFDLADFNFLLSYLPWKLVSDKLSA